jgi:signal peptidase I
VEEAEMKIRKRWKLLIAVLATMVVLVSVRSAGAGVYRLAGESMAPGLHVGDMVLVNKLAYDLKVPFTEQALVGWSDPLRGDVVLVFVPAPDGGTMPAFKRVIGVSGDVVEVRDCRLIVNGRQASYEPADPAAVRRGWPGRKGERLEIETFAGRSYPVQLADGACEGFGPSVVPRRRYFLLGDSRFNSRDSRSFGPLRRDSIQGRIAAVLSQVAAPGDSP